nr:LuxR family transcriptional regulator [Kibdelosporangium sp. MJ126-NF4]CEL17295.1 Tetratricopeptide repeat-containing protein / Transcriptional regulator, LuxR family [Kibdelosporangium sp. MJ126-NF4]CTQ91476.1 Tetratricopeptide repeat-containing protein / Transcriptional regulator, LuxR family [Kibdelosporangium sp. MJ126-NF4]
MEPRLTGRDQETAVLAEILAEAESGTGRLVLISGEAGIGKTRLARHASEAAQRLGFAVLSGQADPLQAGLAYSPIVTALRAHLASLPTDTSTEFLRRLPDLGRLITDPRLPRPAPGGDPALNRTHMFEAVLRLLQLSAPLVLVVDDLHWADDGTIELVHYLGHGATAGQIVVIGTCRTPQSGQRLTELAALVRRNGAELALRPLTGADLADLLHDLLGEQPGRDLLAEMSTRTKGVPLFVTALAPHAAVAGHGPLPAIVRDVVLGRLHTLDEPERAMLDLIAVAGTSATDEVIGTTTRDPALHSLLRQGIVDEHVIGRQLTYRVSHPLYAEVAYAELTEGERRQLHARLAVAIDHTTPDCVLASAPHYRDAGEFVDAQRAIDVFTAAGRRALGVLAAAEAIDYLTRASALAEVERPEFVPDLMDLIGSAHVSAGHLDQAAAIWSELLRGADETARLRLLPRLAMLESERGNADAALGHADAISRLRGEADVGYATMRILLSSRHLPLPLARRSYQRLLDAFADAPDRASRAVHGTIASLVALLDNDFRTAHQHLTVAEEDIRASAVEIPELAFGAHRVHSGVCLVLGDLPSAAKLAAEASAADGAFVLPSVSYTMRLLQRMVQYFTGDVVATLAALDEDIDGATRTHLYRLTARMRVFRAYLLAELGRVDEATQSMALARLRPSVSDNALDFGWASAAAIHALHSGKPDQAPVFTQDGFTFRNQVIGCLRLTSASEASIAAKDTASAAAVQSVLHATRHDAPMLTAISDRHDGLLDGDTSLLLDAARGFEKMGARLLAAKAALEAAELAPDRELILRCLDQFQASGVTPWLDRARRLARSLGIVHRTGTSAGPLTKREAEVVRLVGQGLSNADVATRLFLSARTVETHLRNSYRKLGITSRLRLAQWAARNEGHLGGT